MSSNHFAVVPGHRGGFDLPPAEYQVGDYVTAEHGTVRITGRPHRENYGARFAAVAVFWPAELATAPHELTRAGRTAP